MCMWYKYKLCLKFSVKSNHPNYLFYCFKCVRRVCPNLSFAPCTFLILTTSIIPRSQEAPASVWADPAGLGGESGQCGREEALPPWSPSRYFLRQAQHLTFTVFGPPGSGSISQRYGSESESLYHQAKIVRKALIPAVLWLLLDFLSLKIM